MGTVLLAIAIVVIVIYEVIVGPFIDVLIEISGMTRQLTDVGHLRPKKWRWR